MNQTSRNTGRATGRFQRCTHRLPERLHLTEQLLRLQTVDHLPSHDQHQSSPKLQNFGGARGCTTLRRRQGATPPQVGASCRRLLQASLHNWPWVVQGVSTLAFSLGTLCCKQGIGHLCRCTRATESSSHENPKEITSGGANTLLTRARGHATWRDASDTSPLLPNTVTSSHKFHCDQRGDAQIIATKHEEITS